MERINQIKKKIREGFESRREPLNAYSLNHFMSLIDQSNGNTVSIYPIVETLDAYVCREMAEVVDGKLKLGLDSIYRKHGYFYLVAANMQERFPKLRFRINSSHGLREYSYYADKLEIAGALSNLPIEQITRFRKERR